MKTSVTITFFLLFVVVAVCFYSLVPIAEKVKKTEDETVSMQLFQLEDDDAVTWIQIQNLEDKESITLKRQEGRWMIVFPITASADDFMANGLVTALTASKKARRLEREGPWEDYGLLKPSLRIGVQTKKNSSRKYLFLGDQAPIGNFVFARWENEEDYFLLDDNLKKAFNRSVYSLRLKQVFSKPLHEIKKVRFRTASEEYELARYDDKWFWMEPIPILGEVVAPEFINQLLARVRDLYVKDFLDDEKRERDELGFAMLGQSIHVWGPDESSSDVLLIGSDVPSRDAVYGLMEGDEGYILIAKSHLQTIFHEIENLAKKFINQELTSVNALS